MSAPAPRTRRPSIRHPRWTLRRRLVAVVVVLLATVAAAMGVVSTLALRSSLIGQIDARLAAASERAQTAPERYRDDFPPLEDEDAVPDPPASDVPPALGLPGQDVGTVNVYQRDGITQSGYLDDDGESQQLTDAQLDVLLGLTPDGTPVTVDLPDLGSYRVVAVTNDDGDLSVTALPLAGTTSTVDRFLAVELAVAVIGLLAGATLATVLVRRELRPLDRVAATAGRVARMPLARGEVEIAERVPEQDTDPATEVGQVGAALNQMLGHVESALTARHESETQVRRFVADASHELRTPLASIRGYAELVQRRPGDLPEDAVRAMGRVESEAKRMTGLVEDMLLLARLDAGRDLDLTEVDLTALAVDAVADAHVAGPDHDWHLDLGTEGDEPPAPVIGDEHRLRQVLLNLLSNARVHTPPGTRVTVSVREEGDQVVLRVRDDGPGIPEPLRSRLFERFARGDESRNRAAGSTGLGLAIVHAVVTAHDGTIEVDGTPGATTFTVRLPRAA
ncbi:sensor histidine kinase [Cellulomonas denverensis]|nr:HAMP domain-containing sensor histidine kinase [Cellulomonas denverensis]GIG26626.1 sensor histidine kinase [Cellulomonas denverensis]